MAKDPRFNFYPDNWIGGTEGFTLEQEGAYLSLVIMQSKIGRFTAEQAFDKLMQKTRGNAAASTKLWNFLIPKFETDGNLFWNQRLENEIEKSKKHSKVQSDRAIARWENEKENPVMPRHMPVYGNGIGIEELIKSAFDEIYLQAQRMQWGHIDFDFEFKTFCEKVRGSPGRYHNRDPDGMRLALQSQLRNAKSKKSTKTNYKVQ
jgi:hypothetical protein